MTRVQTSSAFLTGGLVLISLISGYFACDQVRDFPDAADLGGPGSAAVPAGGAAVALAPPFTLPELRVLEQTLHRPLFSPSREQKAEPSPAPVVAKPTKPKIAPPPKVALKGVVISSDRRSALIAMPDQPDAIWVDEGDVIEGWKIASIRSGHLTLRSGDSVERVSLDRESGTP